MDTAGDSDSTGEQDAPIIIRIKFKRSPTLVELRAVSYESDDSHLRAKDGNAKTIADFLLDEVAGWWVQPDTASISLAERMKKASERVAKFHAADQALKSTDNHHEKTKYASYKRAIDGIRIILKDFGRPMSQEELAERLINGGFRGGLLGTDQVINRSIKNFLTGSGRAKGHIKEIGGLIGLADWDNSRFKA